MCTSLCIFYYETADSTQSGWRCWINCRVTGHVRIFCLFKYSVKWQSIDSFQMFGIQNLELFISRKCLFNTCLVWVRFGILPPKWQCSTCTTKAPTPWMLPKYISHVTAQLGVCRSRSVLVWRPCHLPMPPAVRMCQNRHGSIHHSS